MMVKAIVLLCFVAGLAALLVALADRKKAEGGAIGDWKTRKSATTTEDAKALAINQQALKYASDITADPFGPCPKCTSASGRVIHRPARVEITPTTPNDDKMIARPAMPEHLQHICNACGFMWASRPAGYRPGEGGERLVAP